MRREALLQRPARSVATALFLAILFWLPFELPVAHGLHGTLSPFLGRNVVLVFVGPLLLYAACALALSATPTREQVLSEGLRDFVVLALLFVGLGVYASLTTFGNDGNVDGSLRTLLLGHLVPVGVCGALLLESPNDRRRAWTVFFVGYVAFLVASFGFLAVAYGRAGQEASSVLQLPIGVRLVMWRYTFSEPWNVYAQFVGNANKTSNNILMFLLLSTRLLGEERLRSDPRVRRVYLVFWVLGSLTLIILFSRATLMLLPLVVAASGVWRFVPRRVMLGLVVGVLASLVAAQAAYSDAFTYLLTSRALDSDADFLGTYGSRFAQWGQAVEFAVQSPRIFVSGMGTSGYSLRFFGDSLAGTHNTFLDTFFESGIGGVLLLAALLIAAAAMALDGKNVKPRDSLVLVATGVLVLLMTREHTFAYLFATSLGGFCVVAILFVLAERRLGLPTGQRVLSASAGYAKAPTSSSA